MILLNEAVPETLLDAVAIGVKNSSAYSLPTKATLLTWQSSFGSAPSAVTLQLQVSNDNLTWNTIDSSTSTSGEAKSITTSATFVRVRINAATDGDTVTVTLVAKSGFIGLSTFSPTFADGTFSGNVSIAGTLDVVGQATLAGLAYPTADGTSGQAIVTDGAGNLSFATVSGGFSYLMVSGGDVPGLIINDSPVTSAFTSDATNSSWIAAFYSSLLGADYAFLIGQDNGPSHEIGLNFGLHGEMEIGFTPSDSSDTPYVLSMWLNQDTIPGYDDSYDLGRAAVRWRNGQFSGVVTASGFTVSGLSTPANKPVCFDTDGKLYAGTNTAGVLSCP